MDAHTTDISNEEEPKQSWRQSPLFQSLEALRPWMQWGLILVMAIGGLYLYQRDTNAQQVINLSDLQRKQDVLQKTLDDRWTNRNKEMSELKGGIVTKEIFDERTNYINKRLDQIDERTMEILDRLPIRTP